MFPDAKFVHLFRHGPDTAVSMSQHTGFRLMALIEDALELLDLEQRRAEALGCDWTRRLYRSNSHPWLVTAVTSTTS